MTVTFFGHRQIPSTLQPVAYSVLCDLIENKDANEFYIGNNGEFDVMIKNTLLKIKQEYLHIKITVVLAYLPSERKNVSDSAETVFPENVEKVPRKFAIISRNKWMINKSDCVVSFVTNTASNSSKFTDIAQKKGKQVINLANLM